MENKKEALKILTDKFFTMKNTGNLDTSSEATARSWIEELLKIFGWNTLNPLEIDQEYTLDKKAKKNVRIIESHHTRPDYVFKKGKQILQYLDAKRISVDIESSKNAAFQIRGYGWSSGLPCSIVSDFEEFAIYDCRYKPSSGDDSTKCRIHYFKFDNYLDNFELMDEHLNKDLVYSGHLNSLYPIDTPPRGAVTLDIDFTEKLREARKELAQVIWKNNKEYIDKNPSLLSNVVQVILDRIIFLRICEGKEIEPENTLYELTKDKDLPFFENFKISCTENYSKHYDGPLFPKSNDIIDNIIIKGNFLNNFIQSLYFPFPYKFDVIPVDLIGNIYEKFLGYRVFIKGNKIEDDFKPEYQKTKGAIYTPRYIVDDICTRVLDPIINNKSIENILKVKVCDPACGSGSFLLGIFDLIEKKITELYVSNPIPKYKEWFYQDQDSNQFYLTTYAKRAIIENCIYGVDLDPEAVEVAKMALALKILENSEKQTSHLNELGLQDKEILQGIGKNIRRGNSLVDNTIFNKLPGINDDEELIKQTLPFDYWGTDNFDYIKKENGGFDAIVGNPPYIETKHFKTFLPAQYEFIKLYYKTGKDGKTDISVPFIEKSLELLNEIGRMGFIVQNRFFKTDYGKATRELLDGQKYIEQIIDFGELKIFQGRMTYTCSLILSKKAHENFNYYKIDKLDGIWETLNNLDNRKSTLLKAKLKTGSLGNGNWSFGHPELIDLKTDMFEKHGTLKDVDEINIKVGLQVLWDKIYHIIPDRIEDGILYGKNRFGVEVKIEEKSCVKMICNEHFYNWRILKPDVYALFPYDIIDNKPYEIPFNKFTNRYPLCAEYLKSNKKLIKESVDCPEGENNWHLYKYEKNLVSQKENKLIVPMTASDTFATFDIEGDYYLDNVNVNSIHLIDYDENLMYAISSIFNSTIFSLFARIIANPQSGGYLKLNKQFLDPIPFPWKNLIQKKNVVTSLVQISKNIISRQNSILKEKDDSTRNALKNSINSLWLQLDTIIEDELYELDKKQKEIVKNNPRAIDRIEMLLR